MSLEIYVKIEGVEGGASHEKYQGWIKADTLSWGVSNFWQGTPTSSGNQTASTAHYNEVSFSKDLCVGSTGLARMCGKGEHKNNVQVKVLRATGGGVAEPYLEYTLDGCVVSHYAHGAGATHMQETVTLGYEKLKINYINTDSKKGTTGGNKPVVFDLGSAKVE